MLAQLVPYARFLFALSYVVILITSFSGVNYRRHDRALPNNQKALPTIPIFICCLLAIQITLLLNFGFDVTQKLYPIHTHFVIILFLVYHYRTSWYGAIMSVLLGYMVCQIPAYVFNAIMETYPNASFLALIAYIIVFGVVFHIILNHFLEHIQLMVKRQAKSFYIYTLIPAGYYLFDYVSTVYSDLLYSGSYRVTQLIPTITCISYFLFVVLLCEENLQYQEATKEKAFLEAQVQKVEIEYEGLKQMQESARIYRHDMRHHFSLLLAMAEQNKNDEIISYLNENIQSIGHITPKKFCHMEMLNLILSRFASEAEENKIEYNFDVTLPETFPFSKTELCSMISNALENALNALNDLDGEFKHLDLKIKEFNDSLVFSVENDCSDEVEIINGMPHTSAEGHGFGTKSIAMIAKKYNGEAVYTCKDNKFRVMVMIPLN